MSAGSKGGWKSSLSRPGLGAQPSAEVSGSPDENPAMRRAVSDQRPLAALNGAVVDTKFFDAGCGGGKLIAALRGFSAGIVVVFRSAVCCAA